MKKYFLLLGLLFIVGCSNENEVEEENTADSSNQEIEESDSPESEESSEDFKMTQEALEGDYEYKDGSLESDVTFDEEGTLKFADGSDSKSYYVNEDYGRVVIDSLIYRVDEVEEGYELLNIDSDGRRTGEDIELIKK